MEGVSVSGLLWFGVAANVLVSAMTGASPVASPLAQDAAAPSPLGLLTGFANPMLAMQDPAAGGPPCASRWAGRGVPRTHQVSISIGQYFDESSYDMCRD
ncbi:Splicing factor 3B subunit 1 [Frankliniella fusca]|uniref:Splicing factor 3B subunit 1 n=1 Tax=Frankliniella fusca TaxID=407009 RepID=A0AAE1I5I6_9NEOP|nr:Splicing factor 3B subunit 1 [Frankliniella fusca]